MSRDDRMSAGEIQLHETQSRAGWYVSRATEGRNQDKRGAALLRCSPTMFWRLKNGDGWTVERMSLAARVFGRSFVDVVFGPITGQAGGPAHDALAAEITELETIVARLGAHWRRAPGELLAARLAARGPDGAVGVVAGADREIRRQGVAGDELDSGDSRGSETVAGAVKRAAE
jgi:hypothetical protein